MDFKPYHIALRSVTLLLTTLFLLFSNERAVAQSGVVFIDKSTGEALPGVHVSVYQNGEVIKSLISDLSGRIVISDTEKPLLIKASHVSYFPLEKQLKGSSEMRLELEENPIHLDNLVVTGQFEPQTIDESVFSVQKIDRKRIESQAAINLADVLSNNLNITLRPNSQADRTTIEMLGLDGRHVKILVDGVPLVGTEGNGNDADITQINMSAIESVEIVEGPMSVNYGANATAGVINLITKKGTNGKWVADFAIQEETVGSEYGLKEGRHIQTLGLGGSLTDKLYARLDYRHNDFLGHKGSQQGLDYTNNDEKRGYEWQPKEQHFLSTSINYNTKWARLKYSFDWMDQNLRIANRIVHLDEHPQTGIERPFAFDSKYKSKRFKNQIQLNGIIKNSVSFDIVSALSTINRTEGELRYRIISQTDEETIGEEESNYKTALTRGNFTFSPNEDSPQFQAGVEHNYQSILSSSISGGERDQNNLAVFANMEWSPVSKLAIRPGLRTIFNSVWKASLVYSLNLKYSVSKNLETRLSYGKSYRTPNLTELYFYFVDANHDVQGNPDLNPEQGYGYSIDLKYTGKINSAKLTSSLKAFYNDIQDQVTLTVVSEVPLRFKYINVDQYQSMGFTLTNGWTQDQLSVNGGVSMIGRLNRLNSVSTDQKHDEFLFSPEYNFNVIYTLTNPNLAFSAFYKRTGKKEQLAEAGDGQIEKRMIEGFDWLDITLGWKVGGSVGIDMGVKNVFNLTRITSTAESGGAHSSAPSSRGLAYGRSYFVKLSYSLKN